MNSLLAAYVAGVVFAGVGALLLLAIGYAVGVILTVRRASPRPQSPTIR